MDMETVEHGTPEHVTEVIERALYPHSFERIGSVEYSHPNVLGNYKLDIEIEDGKKIDDHCVKALQAHDYMITDIISSGVRIAPESVHKNKMHTPYQGDDE